MTRWITAVLVLLAAPSGRADWHLGVEGLTDLPVQAGAGLWLEMPGRLQLRTSVGVLPGSYVQLINAVVVSADGYDRDTADLIERSLKNSLVWRLHVGWRPLAEYGWYLELGYALVALGGGVTGEDLVVLATDIDPPGGTPGDREYDVSSTLHMLDAEIGWRFDLWEGLTLKLAVGFAGTVAASAKVEPDFPVLVPRVVDAFTKPSEDYLKNVYTSYVFTPVFSVGLGWAFF